VDRRSWMRPLAIAASAGLLITSGVTVVAAGTDHKITICHRTNSIHNPYVLIRIDQDAADGDLGNDKGRGDHYMEHQGPIFDPAINTRNGGDWGDIIPAIPGVHDGRNATVQGLAIIANGCDWLPDGSGGGGGGIG
jgi:hypothetical protein